MPKDFFLGFAGHAHILNALEVKQSVDENIRKKNSGKEAQKLTMAVLEKLDRDISDAGYTLKNVKLVILFLSYRGYTEAEDYDICENVLEVIGKKFQDAGTLEQLSLVGHTTAGEIENDDIELARRQKRISGIGYNGISVLAFLTNLPIGVAHSGALKSQKDARENGEKMVRDAVYEFNSCSVRKEHPEYGKRLLVFTQGGKASIERLKKPKIGFEHFLAEGNVEIMRHNRDERISGVFGGSSGDGWIGRMFRQFYRAPGKHAQFQILEDEAVCALIPCLSEVSTGCDISPIKNVEVDESLHKFQFASDKEPRFMYISRIDDENPPERLAHIIFANENRLADERNVKLSFDEGVLIGEIRKLEGFPLLFHSKYGFVFPTLFLPVCPIRTTPDEDYLELTHPVRGNGLTMMGKVVQLDEEKIQQGAHEICQSLRENRRFAETDVTIIASCVSRRLIEEVNGKKNDTEAGIIRETFHSTQLLGFLAYGELSINQDLQPPYHFNFSCWGLTFRARAVAKKPNEPSTAISPSEEKLEFKYETETTYGVGRKGIVKKHVKKSTHPLTDISEKKKSHLRIGPKGGLFEAESEAEEVKKFNKKRKG